MELVVIRHGESLWNAENRFTGWTDIALSKRGMLQAKTLGIFFGQTALILISLSRQFCRVQLQPCI